MGGGGRKSFAISSCFAFGLCGSQTRTKQAAKLVIFGPFYHQFSQFVAITGPVPCPLHPQERTLPARSAMSALCHVWTAPVWQELSSRFCSIGRCSHVFGLLMRFT